MCATHQISERVKLLPHQAALLPPPRDLAVKGVEEEAEREEHERHPQMVDLIRIAERVVQRREDGHDAAETYTQTTILRLARKPPPSLAQRVASTPNIPFNSVIRSARCSALTREKCPTSLDSSIFCLSMASARQNAR